MRKIVFMAVCLSLVTPCAARVITVGTDGTGKYKTIQAAIDAADSNDTIRVKPGVYYENIKMKNGVTLEGSGADVTTINGNGKEHAVIFNTANGKISGFTITSSGNKPPPERRKPLYSAGIFISQATVTIANNIISNNSEGISISSNSNVTIIGNKIINNKGRCAINIRASAADIRNNVIVDNSGHGVFCRDSSPAIINNTIAHNKKNGISCHPTTVQTIKNNIITNNEYGIFTIGNEPYSSGVSSLDISYNNVWHNSTNYLQEALRPVRIMDTQKKGRVYPNRPFKPSEPDEIIKDPDGPFTPQPGTGEISKDSLFEYSTGGDYRLHKNSPCINAGDPQYIPEPNETDADGSIRMTGGRIDIARTNSVRQ